MALVPPLSRIMPIMSPIYFKYFNNRRWISAGAAAAAASTVAIPLREQQHRHHPKITKNSGAAQVDGVEE